MIKKTLIVVAVMIFAAAMFAAVNAQDAKDAKEVKHEFVGAKKCKMCHKKGGVYEGWEASAHATAFDKLDDAGKANKECAPCHTTGALADGTMLTGVECEACHGAGADYKKKSVMEDREAALAAGMILPTEEDCLKCHGGTFPEGHAEVAKFDFAAFLKKGVHPMPSKAEAESK